MSDRDKKTLKLMEEANEEKSSSLPKHRGKSFNPQSKKLRRINPLGYRVVVRTLKDSNQTDTGLYLPEGSKEAMQESILAEVIEVASAIDDDTHEEANVSGVPLGATVLIPKNMGIKVPWDDSLRIIETKNILAIVDEVSIS